MSLEQLEECEALEAILGPALSVRRAPDGQTSLLIEIKIDLGEARDFEVEDRPVAQPRSRRRGPPKPSSPALDVEAPAFVPVTTQRLRLQHLPSLRLDVTLPSSYPLEAPPQLRVRWPWRAPTLAGIENELAAIWQPGEASVFAIVDSLTNVLADATEPVRLFDGRPPRLAAATPFPSYLRSCDAAASAGAFDASSRFCQMCLSHRKGRDCIALAACGHVFCLECVRDYFSSSIREGSVGAVACPDPSCVRDRAKAAAGSAGALEDEELRAIVGDELLARYRWLLDKRRLDADPTVVSCPRVDCQAPVEADPSDGLLRECKRCSFAFCVLCRATWHGTKTMCAQSNVGAIVEKFNATAEGSSERAQLERKYGRSTLARYVAAYEEEIANREWLASNTTPCRA